MSDWIRTHDNRDLYRNADGALLDLTNAPASYIADMVKARREERENKEQIALQPLNKNTDRQGE